MASSTKIRLAPDVEAIAQDVAQKRGLGNVRTAVEAIVRTCADHYLRGDCDSSSMSTDRSTPNSPITAPADGNTAFAELGF